MHQLTLEDSPSDDEAGPMYLRPEAVERRVRRNIFAFIALAVLVAAFVADLRFMLGLVLGGALALLNYKWLQSSLRGVLSARSEKAPPGTMIGFVVRWLMIAAMAWAANKTGYFDAVAILVGLLAPAPAVIIEAGYVAYRSLRTRENNN
jgi:ATP synthase I chain